MIRWINPYLGTGAYDEVRGGPWPVLDVRHLVDKGGNPGQVINGLIREGVDLIQSGRRLVVACDFGVSRSNAIAAGILSVVESCDFDDALRVVIEKTGEREIKLELILAVRSALGVKKRVQLKGRALITGGSGFIGQHLIGRLVRTGNVLYPGRNKLDLKSGVASLAEYCIQNGIEQIVHLAYPRIYTNISATGEALVMLMSVLDVCKLLKIRLLFISGWVVFLNQKVLNRLISEEAPLRPKGVYSETKYLEEMIVDLYYRRGDIERVVCRFSAIYGPGGARPRLLHKFWEAANRGEEIVTHRFRNGRPALDLLYVDDAARAIELVLTSPGSDVFHFGTGELVNTQTIGRLVCKIANRDVPFAEIDIDDNVHNIAFRSDKAALGLDWRPMVSLEKGLRLMLN